MPDLRPSAASGDCTACLTGDLDLLSAGAIADLAGDAIARRAERLQLDLSGVTFMDSQGLRALVLAQRALSMTGATLVLTGLPPFVDSIIDVSGLRQLFVIA